MFTFKDLRYNLEIQIIKLHFSKIFQTFSELQPRGGVLKWQNDSGRKPIIFLG